MKTNRNPQSDAAETAGQGNKTNSMDHTGINGIVKSQKRTARKAGILYLLQIPLGVFGILYLSKGLYVPGDMAATAANILAHETLFRLSIVGAVLAALVTVFTALYLYKLLHQVHKNQARMMVIFTLIVAPISMLNELNKVAMLILLKGSEYSSIYNTGQLHGLLDLFAGLHQNGIQIAGLFWGLWLLPMGYLVYKSDYMPKLIGILLMTGSAGYIVDFLTAFLLPDLAVVVSEYTFIGEVLMVLWLLVFGINGKQFKKTIAANAGR